MLFSLFLICALGVFLSSFVCVAEGLGGLVWFKEFVGFVGFVFWFEGVEMPSASVVWCGVLRGGLRIL